MQTKCYGLTFLSTKVHKTKKRNKENSQKVVPSVRVVTPYYVACSNADEHVNVAVEVSSIAMTDCLRPVEQSLN